VAAPFSFDPAYATWYCVQHRADDGARVRLAIRRIGYEVHWPRFVERLPRKDDRIRPLFPGYLFAAQANVAITGAITEVENVIGLLGAQKGRKPMVVPTSNIMALIDRAGGAIAGVIDETEDARPLVQIGQAVTIKAGAHLGLTGICKRIDGDRIAVLMTWFGGEHVVPLRVDQVELA
jgi:transcription antitermination factor NusG